MQEPVCHENYPARIVVVSNFVSFMIYGIGAYILYRLSLILVIMYVFFLLFLEFRLLGRHCVNCYYYGKVCAFGKGYPSSLIFARGQPEQFHQKTITWKDIVPDFLVFLVPIIAGIILLIGEFSWILLVLIIALFILGFFGNAFVRGQLACRFCKQKEIGCPAEQLFDKQKKR